MEYFLTSFVRNINEKILKEKFIEMKKDTQDIVMYNIFTKRKKCYTYLQKKNNPKNNEKNKKKSINCWNICIKFDIMYEDLYISIIFMEYICDYFFHRIFSLIVIYY